MTFAPANEFFDGEEWSEDLVFTVAGVVQPAVKGCWNANNIDEFGGKAATTKFQILLATSAVPAGIQQNDTVLRAGQSYQVRAVRPGSGDGELTAIEVTNG